MVADCEKRKKSTKSWLATSVIFTPTDFLLQLYFIFILLFMKAVHNYYISVTIWWLVRKESTWIVQRAQSQLRSYCCSDQFSTKTSFHIQVRWETGRSNFARANGVFSAFWLFPIFLFFIFSFFLFDYVLFF